MAMHYQLLCVESFTEPLRRWLYDRKAATRKADIVPLVLGTNGNWSTAKGERLPKAKMPILKPALLPLGDDMCAVAAGVLVLDTKSANRVVCSKLQRRGDDTGWQFDNTLFGWRFGSRVADVRFVPPRGNCLAVATGFHVQVLAIAEPSREPVWHGSFRDMLREIDIPTTSPQLLLAGTNNAGSFSLTEWTAVGAPMREHLFSNPVGSVRTMSEHCFSCTTDNRTVHIFDARAPWVPQRDIAVPGSASAMSYTHDWAGERTLVVGLCDNTATGNSVVMLDLRQPEQVHVTCNLPNGPMPCDIKCRGMHRIGVFGDATFALLDAFATQPWFAPRPAEGQGCVLGDFLDEGTLATLTEDRLAEFKLWSILNV